jgi:hypothetical protein
MLDTGYSMLDAGYSMLDAGCSMLDAGYSMLDAGCSILDAGYEVSAMGTRRIWLIGELVNWLIEIFTSDCTPLRSESYAGQADDTDSVGHEKAQKTQRKINHELARIFCHRGEEGIRVSDYQEAGYQENRVSERGGRGMMEEEREINNEHRTSNIELRT